MGERVEQVLEGEEDQELQEEGEAYPPYSMRALVPGPSLSLSKSQHKYPHQVYENRTKIVIAAVVFLLLAAVGVVRVVLVWVASFLNPDSP